MTIYDDQFYDDNSTRLKSSEEILKFLTYIIEPKSVLDVGCGRGAWLETAKKFGVKILFGIDGEWNNGKKIDKNIVFKSLNLNNSFNLGRKFDLTLCLEVAEHLEETSSNDLIYSLTNSSDVILFSAAFKYQGGIGHLNENLHSYWANLFFKHDFVPFDIIRPKFWNNKKISYWYRQNSFLYVKKNSSKFNELIKKYNYLDNHKFMDCIHPEMYFRKVESQGIKYHLMQIIKNFMNKFQ